MTVCVGIIPNPASGRDLRRLTGHAGLVSSTEKAGAVMRLLGALGSTGVERVLLPPDMTGIAAAVLKASAGRQALANRWPRIDYLDMPLSQSVDDTRLAARMMVEAGVSLIAVLGGDGTHKAVAAQVGDVPLLTLTTGTNNAFPDQREATSAGLAAGLLACGRVPAAIALRRNKRLLLEIPERNLCEWALVDIAVCAQAYNGARAVTRIEDIEEVFVAFAEPGAIGISALCGLWQPVSRQDPRGAWLRLHPQARERLIVPLAPGVLQEAGIVAGGPLQPGCPRRPTSDAGTFALDGEREIEFGPEDTPTIRVDGQGPLSIDVERVLAHAARQRLLLRHVPARFDPLTGEQQCPMHPVSSN
ncbi:Predicted polyphosphate-or ATP-dependent NAD kinase [Pseudomonas flavescens]|uniref:Predicted polyphosphate-or ATP-dependent NAD kinase n=1 Tax=Phytopseudomonas flavescens TaxID=29435 RepID=A0A1G8JHX4_9GAMM|nr:NAD(+)/NADH kinase [Pseudomonas flavescens]SDI30691.1 Predicted polyphosphate-or ATP-dependent NAD kinase [Pseudomonas flavescens]